MTLRFKDILGHGKGEGVRRRKLAAMEARHFNEQFIIKCNRCGKRVRCKRETKKRFDGSYALRLICNCKYENWTFVLVMSAERENELMDDISNSIHRYDFDKIGNLICNTCKHPMIESDE